MNTVCTRLEQSLRETSMGETHMLFLFSLSLKVPTAELYKLLLSSVSAAFLGVFFLLGYFVYSTSNHVWELRLE